MSLPVCGCRIAPIAPTELESSNRYLHQQSVHQDHHIIAPQSYHLPVLRRRQQPDAPFSTNRNHRFRSHRAPKLPIPTYLPKRVPSPTAIMVSYLPAHITQPNPSTYCFHLP